MRVSDGLARGFPNIDPNVVTVRHAAGFDVLSNGRQKSPNGRLFFSGKSKKISLVPPRNNQAVSVI